MYLGFAAPHDPRVAAKPYMDMYQRDQIPLPKNFLPVHPFDNGEMTVRDELLNPWPRTEDDIRRHLHEYYGMITGLDYHIGRLLAHFKDTGLYDNTIIVFSADQGLAIGSHGLMGKQNLYEHSAKSPLFLCGPGIPQGRSDALVYLMDLFPTFCSLVGAPPPEGVDGTSLTPIIYDLQVRVRRSLFLSYRDVQRAIRDDRYKLILYPHNNVHQLFDLETDPEEITNLASDPEFARRIDAMTAAIGEWQGILGDTLPLVSENPSDPKFTPPTGKAFADLRAKLNMD
jgi:arylsulfatase A-like enzyme